MVEFQSPSLDFQIMYCASISKRKRIDRCTEHFNDKKHHNILNIELYGRLKS